VGVAAGAFGVGAGTLLRWGFAAAGGPSADFGVAIYLSVAAAVGWVWGKKPAVAVALFGTVLLLTIPADPDRMTPTGHVFAAVLLLGELALFLYALDQERAARVRAMAQMRFLEREHDRLAASEQKAAALQQRAAQIADEQRAVLSTLQKETLNAHSPRIRGLRFDLAYEPATAPDTLVGGDFYNIFRLSDTRAAVILGDITGKGAHAAASGLVVSSMLRAFFAETRSPALVLRRLNAVLVGDPDFSAFATLFAAIVDGAANTLVYANAGQEPPCLLSPLGNVSRLEAVGGLAVGTLPDEEYEEAIVSVPPGHVLVAFTDGLTEIRRPDGNWMDPKLLDVRLSELGGHPPHEITRRVLAWARTQAGGRLRDDVALLAIEWEQAATALAPRPE
jgi:serine phosphatase RsbU (regulator of sigma subunit)